MSATRVRLAPPLPRGGRALVGLVVATTLLVGCSGGHSSAAPHPREVTSIVAPRATTSTSAATPTGTVTLHATGGVTINASGPGATCVYYVPSTRYGYNYSVSSTSFPGTGSWDFHIQGDGTQPPAVLLNTESGDFGFDPSTSGTVVAGADLHHASFDLDLHQVSHFDTVTHVSGTIDCS
jgi:hypothetical protein